MGVPLLLDSGNAFSWFYVGWVLEDQMCEVVPVILETVLLRREGLILLVAQACLVGCEVAPVDVLAQATSVVGGLDKVEDVQVDDRGEVELALLGDDLRHVAHPDEVGFLGGAVPLDEVRGGWPPARPGQPAPVRLTTRATRPSSAISVATVFTAMRQPLRTSRTKIFGDP
jgi:hypothetical protein